MLMCNYIVLCAVSLNVVNGITVHTNVGNISGVEETVTINNTSFTFAKFLGIPYGESTGGANRFRKPIPKAPFNETFDATQPPVGCIQGLRASEEAYRNLGLAFSEDCLMLNVYVPQAFQRPRSLPVMVWIYGGGFLEGGSLPYPAEGLSAFGQVIVVTINYRVGALGFLRTRDGRIPGNLGLWDQHLAIKWVHDNIEAFGGDRHLVTLFGESAGAASVSLQALYPGNRGLFRRVIAESGTALAYWSVNTEQDTDIQPFISMIGCDVNAINVYSCLRALPAKQLQISTTSNAVTKILHPVVDGDFLADAPHNIIFGNDSKSSESRDFFASLDYMTGVNSYEAASYIVGVWPNILDITDFNNFTLSRETFTKTAVSYALQNLFGIKNNATVDVLRKLVSFAYIDWEHNDEPDVNTKALIDFTNDFTFFYPAILSLVGHMEIKAARASTYMYEFGVVPSSHSFLKSTWIKDPSRVIPVPIPTPTWVNGPNHADELRYVFGIPVYETYRLDNTTPDDIMISKAIMTLWTNFAKTGNPNTPASAANFMPSQEDWSQFDIDSQQYMYMSNQEFSMRSHFRARRMALWGKLVSYIRRNSYVCDQCTGNQGLPIPPLSSVLFG